MIPWPSSPRRRVSRGFRAGLTQDRRSLAGHLRKSRLPYRHGRPVEPADLTRHACLILSRNPGSASWPFRIDGKRIRIDVKGPVSADSADMLLQLAIAGVGILRLSEHVVARSIHEGLLQPLLQDVQDPEIYPDAAGPSSGSQGEGLHRFSDRAPRLRTVANGRQQIARMSAATCGESVRIRNRRISL